MKALLKKFGSFSIGPVIGALLGFLTLPLVTHFITLDEYGRTSMFFTAQNTVSLLVYLGLDQAFVREFHLEKDRMSRLLSNALRIPLLLSLLLSAVLLIWSDWFSVLLFDNPGERLAIAALAALFPFMVIEQFTMLKIRMEENGVLYSLFSIALKAWTLLFTLLLLFRWERSFRSVILAATLAEIVNSVTVMAVSLRKMELLRQETDFALQKRMLCYGLPLVPAYAIGWILSSMDRVMLRAISSYEELGLYTGAFKIVAVMGVLQTCFTLFWTPVAIRWFEQKADLRCFDAVCRLVAVLMTGIGLMVLLCKDLVAFILGESFRSAIYIFPFLLLYPIMYTESETTMLGISFSRKTSYNILVSGAAAAVNLALNMLLIPIWQGKGAAVATGLSYVVFFWMRTLVSGKLWHWAPLGPLCLTFCVLLLNCVLHSFVPGAAPYWVSGASLLALALLSRKGLTEDLAILKENRAAL